LSRANHQQSNIPTRPQGRGRFCK